MKTFNTLGKKIFLGYVGVAMTLIASGTISIWEGRELSAVSEKIRKVRGPTIDSAMIILNGLNESTSALKSWLLLRENAYRQARADVWINELEPAVQRMVDLAAEWTIQGDHEVFAKIRAEMGEMQRLQEEIERMPAARNREAVDALASRLAPLNLHVRSSLETMIAKRNDLMDDDLQFQAAMIGRLTLLQILLVMSGLVACLIMGTLLVRAIAGPIARAIELADRIASGDYDMKINVAGAEELNRLGAALERMRESLATKTWLSQAQIRLNDAIRSLDGVRAVSEGAISTVASILNAHVGVVYVAEGEKIRTVGGYAFSRNRAPGLELAFGEGLAGQAAVARRLLTVRSADDGPALKTVAGDIEPAEILASPLTSRDEVIGVMELASSKPLKPYEQDFLKVASEAVAIALSAAQRGEQVKNLLQETQAQAEELQAQQEELRQANDELQTRQEELESTNEELEEQREALDQRNVELEAAQRSIAERAADLDRVSRYKSEFLANMSHELRTPLNSQLILSKMLAENKDGNLTSKQVEFVKTIHSTGLDLLQLINDILDLSKVEAGKLSLEIKDVVLRHMVRDWDRDFRHTIEGKKLQFVVEVDEALPETVRTDQHRLGQVLRNLLSNATKFTSEGKITLQIGRPEPSELHPYGALAREKAIAVRVIDTGIGIPENKQQAVFQAFEQVDSSISRKYGGTGLGLAISSSLANLLGGRISLKSQVGQGSRFTIVIPEQHEGAPAQDLRETSSTLANDQVPARRVRAGESGTKTQENLMLIVEDDPNFARILADIAEAKGFRTLIATDGAEGLELAQSKMPECILLDYDLPQLNGLKVLKELKNDPATRHIPVHMISVEDHSKEAQKSGAIGYLVKPADPKRLQDVMDRLKRVSKKDIRKVLVVDDDPVQLDSIIELIGNGNVKSTGVATAEAAYRLLQKETFDCMVLDLRLPDMSGFELLDKLHGSPGAEVPPVVVYTARELSHDEEQRLRKYSDSIIIKGARASDRLLDEVSLFIHRVVKELPQEKQKILTNLYNPEKTLQGKQILLVDDDVRNVFSLSNALEEKGMKITIARNGKEAIEALDRNPAMNLVLMDIMMPVMDGYEAMRQIRKNSAYGRVPVIALTAKAMKEDREMCLAAGASDYLPKPVDLDRLMTLLRVWLSK